ncbi:MAG: hypothetical protein HYR55_04860 [Acidobacteria bacterium]|nr:hypothetical protein [Acidobacteriota bacterium]MBI3658707.1 hypothetical protein [Acidobacteriota bacterium]
MDEIALLVSRLSDAQAAVRASAAEQLYARGTELVAAVLNVWNQDPELKRLVAGPVTVGIAVEPERFVAIRAAWGNPPPADVPQEQQTIEFEIHSGEARLDILAPERDSAGSGPIDKFLARHGEEIQQVELACSDVFRATQILFQLAEGASAPKPIYAEPRRGANGATVNFILMPLKGGAKLLVELVQSA